MQIYLARNNQQAGPYTVEQVNQMLSNQQVLLTDLAWYQGMAEWKALGELTHGQLFFQPEPQSTSYQAPEPQVQQREPQASRTQAAQGSTELASYVSRAFAKIIDLFLWLPTLMLPAFFINADQLQQLTVLSEKMQSATTSDQAMRLQQDLINLIPVEALQAMLAYVLCMLVVQAILLAKSGQSIGKKLTRIKIVDADSNEKVGLTRIFLIRSVVFIIFNLTLFPLIALIDLAFALTAKRQALHDKLAKTKVINL